MSHGFPGGSRNTLVVMALNGHFDGTANANMTEIEIETMAESQELRGVSRTTDVTWIERMANTITCGATGPVGAVSTRLGLETKDATKPKRWTVLEAWEGRAIGETKRDQVCAE